MQEILILEPNRETARRLKDHFESYGFTVVCVESVNEGITALSDHPPDLIISEFRLPGNDLERLCRFIGKEGEHTTVPLLFTTAAPRSPRIQQEVKRIGADAILYKPFSFQTLLERIERIRVGRRFYRKSRITLGKEERWEEIPLSGRLETCGFPELIRLLRLGSVTGALTLEKAHAFRILYWKGGELIALTDTFSRSENLGYELLQEGRISSLQYEHLFSGVLTGREALLEVPEDPENHALHLALEEAIAAKGWIDPHELHEAATRRLRRKFIGIWGWRQGAYRLTRQPPPPFASRQGSFELPGLVFEAIGRFGNFAELRRRTRDWDRVEERPLERFREVVARIPLKSEDHRFLNAYADHFSISRSITHAGIPLHRACQILHTLDILGVLTREGETQKRLAPLPEPVPPPPPAPSSSLSVTLKERGGEEPLEQTHALSPPEGGEVPSPSPSFTGRLAEGDRLGPYRILEQIGEGGMARIYKAYHEELDRFVAIKVISDRMGEKGELLERFIREAQALAHLNAPQIVQIYDIDTTATPPYFAMEYIEGITLKDFIAYGKDRSPERILEIVTEVCLGLEVASEAGIIHRDINPKNIMLTREGGVKITDFGLVKSKIWDKALTSSSVILGTPYYLSPELIRGDTIDHRSDIYALGITTYELFVGTPPFDADDIFQLLRLHEHAPLPLHDKRDVTIPGVVCDIIEKMTRKHPSQRYQTYREIIEDCRRTLSKLRAAR